MKEDLHKSITRVDFCIWCTYVSVKAIFVLLDVSVQKCQWFYYILLSICYTKKTDHQQQQVLFCVSRYICSSCKQILNDLIWECIISKGTAFSELILQKKSIH